MKNKEAELIPTRASLLHRLKNWQDDSSWRDFFNIYWKLIYGVGRKAGLSDAEAQDVVQETLISVAKHMPTFRYDPSIGSFKAWLLNMTRWRIIGQLRKRQPTANRAGSGSTRRTDLVEEMPDPNAFDLDQMWEAEWENNLLQAALQNLKPQLDPQKIQIFDFYVTKEWPPAKVAERFGVSLDQVYQIKHRMTEALRTEVERLAKEMV